jgi:hypothetical protein
MPGNAAGYESILGTKPAGSPQHSRCKADLNEHADASTAAAASFKSPIRQL